MSLSYNHRNSDHGAQAISRMVIKVELAIAEWKVYQARECVPVQEKSVKGELGILFLSKGLFLSLAFGTDDVEQSLSAKKKMFVEDTLLKKALLGFTIEA
ncbi:hypothetical protein ACROYT_G011989 [Oculina patagonica]